MLRRIVTLFAVYFFIYIAVPKTVLSLFTVYIVYVFWFSRFLHPALSNADIAMNSEVIRNCSGTLGPCLQNLLDSHAPPSHVLRNDRALSVAHGFHDF